jgi:hypothetical protein
MGAECLLLHRAVCVAATVRQFRCHQLLQALLQARERVWEHLWLPPNMVHRALLSIVSTPVVRGAVLVE